VLVWNFRPRSARAFARAALATGARSKKRMSASTSPPQQRTFTTSSFRWYCCTLEGCCAAGAAATALQTTLLSRWRESEIECPLTLLIVTCCCIVLTPVRVGLKMLVHVVPQQARRCYSERPATLVSELAESTYNARYQMHVVPCML
jgi:hypothetical protein